MCRPGRCRRDTLSAADFSIFSRGVAGLEASSGRVAPGGRREWERVCAGRVGRTEVRESAGGTASWEGEECDRARCMAGRL